MKIIFWATIALTTFFTRLLPFLFFPEHKKTPAYIKYLGANLPLAMIGLLLIYCLKEISLINSPYGLPELSGVATTALLHLWKNNTFLSIAVGTGLYLILRNFIFI